MSFKWLKHYMPGGIYARAALILLLPVVVVQLVVSVVFVQRHFEAVTNQMTDAAVREIALVLDHIDKASAPEAVPEALSAVQRLAIVVAQAPPDAANAPDQRLWYDFSGRVIIRNFHAAFPVIAAVDLTGNTRVHIVAQTRHGAMQLSFDRRRVSATAPHQLLVNMVFFSIIVTVIAFIYMRNQLRPIKRLAQAAQAFGRGRIEPYAPSGATEVRAAGTAFVDMRNRIERQIETRTLMLSGVSHDLRTPLTRMRLTLSMLEDDARDALNADVDDMQRMIDAFLSFAKGDSEGDPELVDPVALVKTAVDEAQRAGQPVALRSADGQGQVTVRVLALRRALDNLISNAVRYGKHAEVSVRLTDKSLRFRVEDDGPGIPEAQRSDAQRPFTRLDPARNQDLGGSVGLGLAIAKDIARAHGGVLRLGRSERMGGLRADIVIAR